MVVTTEASPTKTADLNRHVFPSDSMTEWQLTPAPLLHAIARLLARARSSARADWKTKETSRGTRSELSLRGYDYELFVNRTTYSIHFKFVLCDFAYLTDLELHMLQTETIVASSYRHTAIFLENVIEAKLSKKISALYGTPKLHSLPCSLVPILNQITPIHTSYQFP
jgi:hypothetical protein